MAAPELTIQYLPIGDLKQNRRNARTHTKRQIRQVAKSIKEFGFVNPLLIQKDGTVIAGHGRLAAAILLGLATIPTIALEDL